MDRRDRGKENDLSLDVRSSRTWVGADEIGTTGPGGPEGKEMIFIPTFVLLDLGWERRK